MGVKELGEQYSSLANEWLKFRENNTVNIDGKQILKFDYDTFTKYYEYKDKLDKLYNDILNCENNQKEYED